ncbi:MAG: DUF5615 family PIN-like protein [Gemmataceae bacterium]|nr:DUF5615 family PIN-like protein [Gemmataceae bacterium]
MNLRLLIDMNLSPDWIAEFMSRGWDAVHWCEVGDPAASDATIMSSTAAHRLLNNLAW